MILRSQLRMNKNIVFPFISCIMIMLTLLVLIHKSADELSAVKQDLRKCEKKHDSLYNQYQSVSEYKRRLDDTLQNEKAKEKENEDKLAREKEDRRKEKEECDNRYDALNQRFSLKENENKELNDDNEKLRKKLVDKEEEFSKLNAKLIASRTENEQLLSAKNKVIEDLKEKLKKYESGIPPKKVTPETNENVPLIQHGEPIQANPNSTTPNINPDAIANNEDSVKLAAVPPPPAPQAEPESPLQQQMLKDLNVRLSGDQKPEENVMKPPEHNNNNPPQEASNGYKKEDFNADNKNSAQMFIPMPNMGQDNKNVQPSVASNNVVVPAPADDQQQVLPLPNQNPVDKGKEIPRNMNKMEKDYLGDYGKEGVGEDEGEEGEYMENDIGKAQPPPKKVEPFLKQKYQDEAEDAGESVVVHPK